MDQQHLSERAFGTHAANYLTSSVHATGVDLERLTALTAAHPSARALDLGCGAGHVSFALARALAPRDCAPRDGAPRDATPRVVAYDPSPAMLSIVAHEASSRGLAIETCVGTAETLPFDDNHFDWVVTRYSAHHWASVPRALAECARVLAPGGRLIVIDMVAPEAPLLDTSLQVVEFLRDASHVRDYRVSEWTSMLAAAGFVAPTVTAWKITHEFSSWIARIGTPPARVSALRTVFAALPSEVRDYFDLTDTPHVDGAVSFKTDTAWMETTLA